MSAAKYSFLLFAPLYIAPALAANFSVDTVNDGVDVTLGDGLCLSASGACTLRAAIQEANALAGPDTITLPAGNFQPSLGNTDEDEGTEGDWDITSDIAISGAGEAQTIINGLDGGSRLFHILESDNRQPVVTLKDLSLTGGELNKRGAVIDSEGDLSLENITVFSAAPGGTAILSSGRLTIQNSEFSDNCRVIYSDSGQVDIQSSSFSNNQCSSSGVAIYSYYSTLSIEDSTFENNSSTSTASFGAGAIYAIGGRTMVTNSQFSENIGGSGGAINATSGSLYVTQSYFNGNRANRYYGGAIYSNSAQLEMQGSTFEDNSSYRQGGAVYSNSDVNYWQDIALIDNRSDIESGGGAWVDAKEGQLSDLRVSGNVAKKYGGGLVIYGVSIDRAVFLNNSANDGGALYTGITGNYLGNQINNATFSGNTAIDNGGAIFNSTKLYSTIERTDLSHATFANNTAAAGKGANIHSAEGILRVRASIFDLPQSGNNCDGVIGTLGYNLSSDESCTGFTGTNDQQSTPANLGSLTAQAGSLETYELVAGSPAIGAVPFDICTAVDQNKLDRYVSTVCSAGAHEPASTPASTGTLAFTQSTYTFNEFDGIATISVTRSGGTHGKAHVRYSETLDGTAVLGTHYIPEGGSYYRPSLIKGGLSWADGEDGTRTINIALRDTTLADPNKTLVMALTLATGTATIDQASDKNRTVISILDDESNEQTNSEADSSDDTETETAPETEPEPEPEPEESDTDQVTTTEPSTNDEENNSDDSTNNLPSDSADTTASSSSGGGALSPIFMLLFATWRLAARRSKLTRAS